MEMVGCQTTLVPRHALCPVVTLTTSRVESLVTIPGHLGVDLSYDDPEY